MADGKSPLTRSKLLFNYKQRRTPRKSPSDGVSPWRAARPRKPLTEYKDSPYISVKEALEGKSPPNSNFNVSTRMGTSLGVSSPTISVKIGSGLDVSNGASPNLVGGNDAVKRAKQRSPLKESLRTKLSSTNIKNSSQRTKSKLNKSELSEEDQPSVQCQHVGNSSSVSNTSDSTLDITATNSVKTSTTRKLTKSKKTAQTKSVYPCDTEEPPSDLKSVCSCVITVITLSILILVYTANQEESKPYLDSLHHQSSAEHWTKVRGHLKTNLKTIIPKFPNQTRDRWILISATLKSPLQPSPQYPGVLILVSTPSTRPTLLCLTSQLLIIASKALGRPGLIPPPPSDLIFPSSLYAGRNIKQELTDKLHSILSSNGVAAVVDLDQLHPDAALTLHAFADNSNAPYRQSVIILTLTVDDGVEHPDNQKVESLAEKRLKSKWLAILGPDKFYALISRLVVNVLVVKGEDETSLLQNCPEG